MCLDERKEEVECNWYKWTVSVLIGHFSGNKALRSLTAVQEDDMHRTDTEKYVQADGVYPHKVIQTDLGNTYTELQRRIMHTKKEKDASEQDLNVKMNNIYNQD